jgi:tetratricopeptide (TPR) repeat protein
VVKALDAVFPALAEFGTWPLCKRLYPQAVAVARHVEGMLIEVSEASNLLKAAGIYTWRRGSYEEAEPLFQRALTIREKALGPDHPEVGASLNNLASLYGDQGRYEEAEPLYQRALAIYEKALSPDHPDVAHPVLGLAHLHQAQNRPENAEPLFRRALALRESALGPGHPLTVEAREALDAFLDREDG